MDAQLASQSCKFADVDTGCHHDLPSPITHDRLGRLYGDDDDQYRRPGPGLGVDRIDPYRTSGSTREQAQIMETD
jgi:hypothetical protein